jgi:hypothetical protein
VVAQLEMVCADRMPDLNRHDGRIHACIVVLVFGAMKSTDVYKTAIARARASGAVTDALGSPLKEGWFLSGSTNANGSSGNADIAIPISGRKARAQFTRSRRNRRADGPTPLSR